MLVRSCLKSYMLGFSIIWTKNFQTSKLGLEKAEEPESKLSTFSGSQRKLKNCRKNIYLYFIDYNKAFVWIITNCGKLLNRWEYQTILPVSWETCMWVKKHLLETCMEKLIDSRLKKEYNRDVCCHSAWLTYMLSTLWEMPGWMNYKWE